jgi:hypothetical protein
MPLSNGLLSTAALDCLATACTALSWNAKAILYLDAGRSSVKEVRTREGNIAVQAQSSALQNGSSSPERGAY